VREVRALNEIIELPDALRHKGCENVDTSSVLGRGNGFD